MKREVPFDPGILNKLAERRHIADGVAAEFLEPILDSALSTLSERQLTVLGLKMAGVSHSHIAADLKVSVATVASTWDVTKRKLARELRRNEAIREVLNE